MKVYGVVPSNVHTLLHLDVGPEFNENIWAINMHQFGGPRAFGTRFILRTVHSDGLGARRSPNGRRTINACWHVHLALLDRLAKQAHALDMMDQFRIVSPFVTTQKGQDYHHVRYQLLCSQHHNMGDRVNQVRIVDLCDCENED